MTRDAVVTAMFVVSMLVTTASFTLVTLFPDIAGLLGMFLLLGALFYVAFMPIAVAFDRYEDERKGKP